MTWNSGTALGHPRTEYTPSWTGSVTNPANWTLTSGWYHRIGNLIICRNIWTASTSPTYGSGTWSVSLPVTARSTSGAMDTKVGECYMTKGGNLYPNGMGSVDLQISSTPTTVHMLDMDMTLTFWGKGSNLRWITENPTVGDRFHLSFFYEAA